MYGFSGYATNSYASERQASSLIRPVIRFAVRTLQNSYRAAQTIILKFRTTALRDPVETNTTLTL